MEEVQDELVQRLTLGRSTHKKLQVPPESSSNLLSLTITYDSPPNDVRAWLEAKGFSRVWVSRDLFLVVFTQDTADVSMGLRWTLTQDTGWALSWDQVDLYLGQWVILR